ncbi:hypothetical protein [Nostoc sp.]|uniref:hypothetical protein n=1 Tax=Nostoc sp. TaxID=1180 RepID=UPI002FF937B7
MNYIQKILNNTFIFINNRLSLFEKIIYLVLVTSLIIVTLISLIQAYPYYFALIVGFLIFLIGIYLSIKKRIRHQDKVRNFINKNTTKNYNNVNTKGGNYNEHIEGNYIQGDYINIQNKQIDISEDVNQILGEFQNILTKLINQGCSIEEAVTQLANDLANEARRKPEIKSKFLIEEDANDNEVKEEFITLLNLLKNETLFSFNYDEDNNSNDYEERISYKGYTIYLETDKDGCWHYKIDGIFYDNIGESYSRYSAMDEAKGKIDEERFRNW